MKNTAIIRIASRLFPGRDLWKLTSEEMSKVMDIYNDYY